jgi:hypothetical protein
MAVAGAVLDGMLPSTLQFLIAMIGCAINERLQRKLDYSLEEIRVLQETVDKLNGDKRLSFTVEQRRRLAVAGKELSPAERRSCCQIVKPATLLAWYRQYCGRKYDSSTKRRGRPRKDKSVRELVIELARCCERRHSEEPRTQQRRP